MIGTLKRGITLRVTGYDGLVVWGAGSGGKTALHFLPAGVKYVVDSFATAPTFEGLPVKRPDALVDEEARLLVIIASSAEQEIRAWIASHGFRHDVIGFRDLVAEACTEGTLRSVLAADLVGYWQGSWVETLLRKPQYLVNVSYRLCRWLAVRQGDWMAAIAYWPARLWHAIGCVQCGIDLPIEVEAGPGLTFAHPGAIVLHRRVRLGKMCTLYQGTTLGADKRGGVPCLGDKVTIWAGAVVVGACTLGDETEVGANTTCFGPLDVKGALLVGSPARIAKKFRVDHD